MAEMVEAKYSACPACGENHLELVRRLVNAEYDGNSSSIVEQAHSCSACGALIYDAGDVRENRREWIRFRKLVDRIPLGCEIEAMRRRSGLTQKRAGEVFGGGPVAFSKYEADDIVPDAAMANLLRMAVLFPDTVERLMLASASEVRISTHTFSSTGYEDDSPDVRSEATQSYEKASYVEVSEIVRKNVSFIESQEPWPAH